jgi:hypothetical protein
MRNGKMKIRVHIKLDMGAIAERFTSTCERIDFCGMTCYTRLLCPTEYKRVKKPSCNGVHG